MKVLAHGAHTGRPVSQQQLGARGHASEVNDDVGALCGLKFDALVHRTTSIIYVPSKRVCPLTFIIRGASMRPPSVAIRWKLAEIVSIAHGDRVRWDFT